MFFKVVEELFDKGFISRPASGFKLQQRVLNQQITISNVQAIPEVFFSTDITWRNPSVVTSAVSFRLNVRNQQPFKEKGDNDNECVRDVREGGLLPLFNRTEKVARLWRMYNSEIPVKKLLPLECSIRRYALVNSRTSHLALSTLKGTFDECPHRVLS